MANNDKEFNYSLMHAAAKNTPGYEFNKETGDLTIEFDEIRVNQSSGLIFLEFHFKGKKQFDSLVESWPVQRIANICGKITLKAK